MNPYAEILKLTENEKSESDSVLTTGKVLSVSPLKVQVGELDYDAEDFKFLAHVTVPVLPEEVGTQLFLVTLDGRQTFYVIGRF